MSDPSDPVAPTLANASLSPHRLDDNSKSSVGALYDHEGRRLDTSVRTTDPTDRHHSADPPFLEQVAGYVGYYGGAGSSAYVEDAVFGGFFFQAWGHLITETLGSAWAAPEFGSCHIVLVPWERAWFSAIPRALEMMRLAGWSGPISLIADGATFGRVVVPQRLIDLESVRVRHEPIPSAMDSVYETVRRSVGADAMRASVVFLSRVPGHRREHPQEREIEQLLQATGIPVLRGWEMTVADQLKAVHDAVTLVGLSGSNLHNSVFAPRGARVVEILDQREEERESSTLRGLQAALCELRGQTRSAVSGYRDGVASPASRVVQDVLRLVDSDG